MGLVEFEVLLNLKTYFRALGSGVWDVGVGLFTIDYRASLGFKAIWFQVLGLLK